MSPRRKSFQPANVAEARALRMTPWRRAFGRRRGRRLWKLTLGVCFLLGLSLGYRLFVTPSVSTWRLIPPEPLWLLEVRKAASYWRKYAGQRSIQGLAASPLLDPLRRAPDWMLLEEALRPDPAAPPDWSRLPWLLGEETTVALYHRGAGDTQLFIASRLHPLVRLRLAWEMLQPARRRTWRVEPHDSGWKIGALDPPFYFVLYGRLLVAANDPTLLAAGEHRIAAQAEPFEELATDTGVRTFLEDLPPDRLGFFSFRLSQTGERPARAFGWVRLSAGEWTARVVAVGVSMSNGERDPRAARRLSERVPPDAPLWFWYAALNDRWAVRQLRERLGVELVGVRAADAERTVLLTVQDRKGESPLPGAALLIESPRAETWQRLLREGRVRVRWGERSLPLRRDRQGDQLLLPLDGGAQYSLSLNANATTFCVGTDLELVEALSRPEATSRELESWERSGNLFALWAEPSRLVGPFDALVTLGRLAARMAENPEAERRWEQLQRWSSALRGVELFRAIGTITEDRVWVEAVLRTRLDVGE